MKTEIKYVWQQKRQKKLESRIILERSMEFGEKINE